MRIFIFPLSIILASAFHTAVARAAAPASETCLPATTKLLISIPNPELARAAFDKSQLGKLVNDPAMEKFNDDLEKQLEGDGRLAERLGIAVSELEEIAGGEIALAVIRPEGEPENSATALVIDVTGKVDKAFEMLKKINARRKAAGGMVVHHQFDRQKGSQVKMPAKGKQEAFSAYYVFARKAPLLICVDHEKEAHAIFDRLEGKRTDTLASVPAFAKSMDRVAKESAGLAPHIRWFLEPFGYLHLRRWEQIAAGTRKRERGRVMIDVYAHEGFDAIQGIGGWINFSESGHEVLHRSMAYAPAVDRAKKDDETAKRLKLEAAAKDANVAYAGDENKKYFLGARMMHFMNKGGLAPWDWIPDDLASHMTFHWQLQRAFQYSETLSNAISDDPKQVVWADTLDSIRDDKKGPKVDVRKDIIAHLGQRATTISDYNKPIDPKSERAATAFEITGDVTTVTAAVNKLMADDPDAVKHEVGDHIIWEIVAFDEEGVRKRREDDEEETVQASATTVAHGYLLRATHVDILKRLVADPEKGKELAASDELKKVNEALDKLGGGRESLRYFARLGRTLEQPWELIRLNKFPQAESMLGNLVARMQGFDPDDPKSKERKQEIDGKNLPGFDFAKAFLGPSGLFIQTEDEGWLVTGVVLAK